MRFRTAIPMVWRTCVFVAVRTTLKRNEILRFLCIRMHVATKLSFSAYVSHWFSTMHNFDAFVGGRFFGLKPCVQIYTRFLSEF